MKIKVENIKQILNDELTMRQRGLLITIMLLKDHDPRITLAKVKVHVKLSDYREDLIILENKGFIEWSGYKEAVKSLQSKSIEPNVIAAIDFMNHLYGSKFNHHSKATTVNLENRLKDHSLEDIKLVVANRYVVWKDDDVMEKFLTPMTIFRPSKFDKYLAEAQKTKQGKGFVSAQNNNLNHGDEITYLRSIDLIDEDVYTIKTISLENGRSVGDGVFVKKYGKDIKRALKIQNNAIQGGGEKEALYFYQEK